MYENAAMQANTLGGIGRAAEPVRQPEISQQLDEIGRAITRLEQAASELCQRLTPAQRPSGPATGGEAKAIHQVMCPMADQLRNYANAIDRIGYMLVENRERLEV